MSELLELEDARYAAQYFIDYFSEAKGDISEYMRRNKVHTMESLPNSLPGIGPEDEFFHDYSMSPEDMEFEIEETTVDKWFSYLQLVSSHNVQTSIPGKSMVWLVKEKNTNKIVGFVRFGSPVINSKPRNEYLGEPLNSSNKDMMDRFNKSVIMGFVIIPVQPFGFNYLGGKLLAAMCCSHHARRSLNKKYDANICGFETTSLYGSSKSASQYDGMKPFLRYTGLTDSRFLPPLNNDNFHEMHDWFKRKLERDLVDPGANSRKLKAQGAMIGITRKSLGDDSLKSKLDECISEAIEMQERKRSFICNYGYTNLADYLTLKTDKLQKAENWDRYELENVISWWKKKAVKRHESLKKDGRLREELEVWNRSSDIDIIR